MIGEQDAAITIKEKNLSENPISFITEEETNEIKEMLDVEEIDGAIPLFEFSISPQKIDDDGNPVINAYSKYLTALNIDDLREFGEKELEIVDIEGNEALISEPFAESLELKEGDHVRAFYGPIQIDMQIKKIYEENGFIDGMRIIVNEDFFTDTLGLPENSYNRIIVSAKGGVKPENYDGPEFKKKVNELVDDFETDTYELSIEEWKQDALDGYGMKQFVLMFIVLSFFGIFAGSLLIVNLYSMLAEERKREMGILRAIALTRNKLMQSFVFEGFLYSLISSAVGSVIGLGIGYALVKSIASMFDQLFTATEAGFSFDMTFGFKMESLIIAFCGGFICTFITTFAASRKVSKLNIVSAIRDVKEKVENKVNFKWVVGTLASGFGLLSSILLTLSFFGVRTFLSEARDQGGDQNPLAEMTTKQFEDLENLIQGHIIFIGVELCIVFGIIFVNRVFKTLFKKDISRITVSLGGIASILFNVLLLNLDSFKASLQQEGGTFLFFLGALSLVISMALVVTVNLRDISRFFTWMLSRFNRVQSAVRMAFRYPAENTKRTGVTLVMFAVIIFLISYVSMIKATVDQESRKALLNSLGGYDVLVNPAPDVTTDQIDEMMQQVKDLDDVEKVATMSSIQVAMPEIKYKDLPEAQYWGDPTEVPLHKDDDSFMTFYDSLPEDYIRKTNIELEKRAKGYEKDSEVWEAVINDSSKVVIGAAFTEQGYGQQPKLKVGDKIVVSDIFEEKSEEKEIIGVVKTLESGGPSVSMYSHIITTNKNVKDELKTEYLDKYSFTTLLIALRKDTNRVEKVNKIKKELINYNINFILNLDDLVNQALSFINSMMAIFQGFLALCLVVGTSGLAIIIARAVHERRQQIGMMRSLGFQKWMILLSFFLESSFITLLGIVIGIAMGTVGALIAFNTAYADQPDAQPIFPWGEISIIVISVYVAAMLFALLPALKASKLSPVEATDYPE